jgi:hypothetical protein
MDAATVARGTRRRESAGCRRWSADPPPGERSLAPVERRPRGSLERRSGVGERERDRECQVGCERESGVGEREGERHAPGVRERAAGARERGKDENEKP